MPQLYEDTNSPQDTCTPPEFLEAVRRIYGEISYDLAASSDNVCPIWFGEETDSLTLDWHEFFDPQEPNQYAWLNPPFKKSKIFLKKCGEEAAKGAYIISLVQSAVGCKYWHELVFGNQYCKIIFVEGRINFVGHGANAKIDCALIIWHPQFKFLQPWERFITWDWRDKEAGPKFPWAMSWPVPEITELRKKLDEKIEDTK